MDSNINSKKRDSEGIDSGIDLEIDIAGVTLKNPVMTASGTLAPVGNILNLLI